MKTESEKQSDDSIIQCLKKISENEGRFYTAKEAREEANNLI